MPFKSATKLCWLVVAGLVIVGSKAVVAQETKTAAPTPAATVTASPSPASGYVLKPFSERLANARSVKVVTSILDLKLGDSLEVARRKLHRFLDPSHPPKEEGGKDEDAERHEADKDKDKAKDKDKESDKAAEDSDEEHRILWTLKKTDYASIFVKLDKRERLDSITGFLRAGKELPFEKIGDVAKAPINGANTVAWDVIRPNRPFTRVLARGSDSKASSISIFVVVPPGESIRQSLRSSAKH